MILENIKELFCVGLISFFFDVGVITFIKSRPYFSLISPYLKKKTGRIFDLSLRMYACLAITLYSSSFYISSSSLSSSSSFSLSLSVVVWSWTTTSRLVAHRSGWDGCTLKRTENGGWEALFSTTFRNHSNHCLDSPPWALTWRLPFTQTLKETEVKFWFLLKLSSLLRSAALT